MDTFYQVFPAFRAISDVLAANAFDIQNRLRRMMKSELNSINWIFSQSTERFICAIFFCLACCTIYLGISSISVSLGNASMPVMPFSRPPITSNTTPPQAQESTRTRTLLTLLVSRSLVAAFRWGLESYRLTEPRRRRHH